MLRRAVTIVLALVAGCTGMMRGAPSLTRAAQNPIQTENARPGTTHWLLSEPAQKGQIAGYPTRESVLPGHQIGFSVRTLQPWFSVSVYRIGWYGGKGGRLVLTRVHIPGHAWPIPKPDKTTGLLDCRWPVSFTITIPDDWVSGIYLVKLTDSLGWQSYIPFTVLEAHPESPLLLVDTVNTSEAYNVWGGKSLYADINEESTGTQFNHRAVEVSFHRPFAESFGAGWFLSWEIHAVRWLEQNGYWVSYADDLDVNDDPSLLLNRKGVLIVGHDEYWTMAMRKAYDAAIAQGVGLANLAANTSYWQVRLAPIGSDPDGVMICYKDFNRDPEHTINPKLTTVTWRDSHVNMPESKFLGAMYGDFEGHHGPYPWVISDPSNWIFQGTGAKKGTSISGIVGHEEDTIVGGYPRPSNTQVLSTSPVKNSAGRRRISHSTIYKASSGAIVFNASTIDWSYGLDDLREWYFDYPAARKSPSPIVEKVTANVLDAMLAG